MKHVDEESVPSLNNLSHTDLRERDTIPPDSERTGPHHETPANVQDKATEATALVFARVVAPLVKKAVEDAMGEAVQSAVKQAVKEELSGIRDGIDAILVFAQEVPAIKAELAEQRVEIEALKAWRREVERAAE